LINIIFGGVEKELGFELRIMHLLSEHSPNTNFQIVLRIFACVGLEPHSSMSAFLVAGITGISHHTWPSTNIFIMRAKNYPQATALTTP
jgi:hypothetical protein